MPERWHHRLPMRLSTIVLGAVFVVSIMLYFLIRPAPQPGTDHTRAR